MSDDRISLKEQADVLAGALLADLAAHSCLFGSGEGVADCTCWPCRARALARFKDFGGDQ